MANPLLGFVSFRQNNCTATAGKARITENSGGRTCSKWKADWTDGAQTTFTRNDTFSGVSMRLNLRSVSNHLLRARNVSGALCVSVLASAATLGLALTAAAQSKPPVTLDVHVDQIKAQASPMHYGLMTEEINYSYDGGLYGELVRNREFHANDSWLTAIEGWKSVNHGGAESSFVGDKTTGPSQAISYSAKVTVESASASARAGLANE